MQYLWLAFKQTKYLHNWGPYVQFINNIIEQEWAATEWKWLARRQLKEEWDGENFHPKRTAWNGIWRKIIQMDQIESDLISESNAAVLA